MSKVKVVALPKKVLCDKLDQAWIATISFGLLQVTVQWLLEVGTSIIQYIKYWAEWTRLQVTTGWLPLAVGTWQQSSSLHVLQKILELFLAKSGGVILFWWGYLCTATWKSILPPLSLPDETKSHSSDPKCFKKIKIWRGSSLGAST